MVADIEELETIDASEIYSRRLNAKEVIFPKENGKFIFQSQTDASKPLEEIRNWEQPPCYGNTQFEEKVEGILLENQKGLFRHLKTHFRMPVLRLTIFGPCQETSYAAITLNPESNFTRREKNRSVFHWSTLTEPELRERIWMLCKNAASMTIGISMDQEICLILGQVSLSLLYWKRNLQTDICSPGEDWQDSSLHPGQIICGQSSGRNLEETLSWRRGINGQWKNRKSIMLDEEIILLTLRTRSSKKPSGMLERNWKHQWLPLCLARHARRTRMVKPEASLMISNKKMRVSWKPVNPHDCVWKNLYRIIMRTISQEEGKNHYSITIWYTNLFLCLKQWRYPQQKQQWIKNVRNLNRFRCGTWRKSEVRKGWSMKQGRRAQKFFLHHWWTSVIWRMPNWMQSNKNIKVELYSEATL